MARQVLPVVGAVVGFYFGGPQGAMWGWQIGSAVGSVVDPQVIPGPTIGEIAQQTAVEGGPRPIVFALSPPMAGNVIISAPPRIVRTKESGKGGPKVETETVYRTYAIGVCEGPITAFYRIWRNSTLVYDASDAPQLTPEENDEFLQVGRLFLGGYDQDVSPDIETIVSPAPAHRGTAYMVMADEDLTDLRGMIPQYTFQVTRCEGLFRTSEIYPVEDGDAMDLAGDLLAGSLAVPPGPVIHTAYTEDDAFDVDGDLLGGALRDPLQTVEGETEALDLSGDLIDGNLRLGIVTTEFAPEAFDVAGDMIGGGLRRGLLVYESEPEALDVSGDLIGGSLT